ncbi:hypothetical protein EVAR_80944_1 [Eumeta japonica]|uniref:Uncharacterized protein n=1 Tax=Eumeta variegata TaxID=151549 RepID=A0A4C1V1J1_EUMVA|nr:hypothetical protein EVAR_80944_1 [Eumeta japonica]
MCNICIELEEKPPHWSNLSTPNRMSEKVNKVRPMLVGGRSIQPVVLLSHPPDLHLYIPLQRINSADYNRSIRGNENREDGALESTDTPDVNTFNEDDDHVEDTTNIVEDEYENSRLATVDEVIETGEGSRRASRRQSDNPLEGPSWLLDATSRPLDIGNARINEPDSTTEPDEALTECLTASSSRTTDDVDVPKLNVQVNNKRI